MQIARTYSKSVVHREEPIYIYVHHINKYIDVKKCIGIERTNTHIKPWYEVHGVHPQGPWGPWAPWPWQDGSIYMDIQRTRSLARVAMLSRCPGSGNTSHVVTIRLIYWRLDHWEIRLLKHKMNKHICIYIYMYRERECIYRGTQWIIRSGSYGMACEVHGVHSWV